MFRCQTGCQLLLLYGYIIDGFADITVHLRGHASLQAQSGHDNTLIYPILSKRTGSISRCRVLASILLQRNDYEVKN